MQIIEKSITEITPYEKTRGKTIMLLSMLENML